MPWYLESVDLMWRNGAYETAQWEDGNWYNKLYISNRLWHHIFDSEHDPLDNNRSHRAVEYLETVMPWDFAG